MMRIACESDWRIAQPGRTDMAFSTAPTSPHPTVSDLGDGVFYQVLVEQYVHQACLGPAIGAGVVALSVWLRT